MIDKDNINDIEELNKQKSINIINKSDDSEDIIINKNNNGILINSLFKLIEENNINELESNLIKDDSVINTLGDNGLSLLHFSVIKGNLPIINTLLKYGANPNILSVPNQQTSLHLAYLSQEPIRENIINALLNYKANDNIIDIYNNRPSDYNKNNNINNLNTPDKKNKIKKEDIYYKINDININFFNTSDVKRKSSNKKKNKDKGKCNCIITPKKNKISDNDDNNQKTDNDYNLSDIKNININFNDNFNLNEKDNNENENDISDTYSNNKLQIKNKEINIYQLNNNSANIDNNENIDNNDDTNEKNCVEKNNTVFYNKEKENNEANNNITNEENNENNFVDDDDKLNDSLEEEDKVNNSNFKDILKSFENINNNMDELFKTIIENKRKLIAERSSHKERKMSNYSNFTSFPKCNIFFNYSNNSCSTQNQTSQKKISNITKEKSKTTSEFKSNYKNIKRTEDNYNSNNNKFINNENITNINDNIINKIIDNRNKFKNWLLEINLPYYYENFIENNIYGIEQLVNLYNSKEPNELFQILSSILKTKKYGHIYKIICKIEMDINIIDSKLIDFMISNSDEKRADMKLSISGGRNVICGKRNEEQNLLKLFLNKYNLSKFYQNFCHNGFDEAEYVIIQMYGKAPINDFVLENYFHIYEKEERKNVLDALIKEVENINKFINSEEYLNKVGIKYENAMYENKGGIQFIINDSNNKCNLCLIY